MSKKMLIDATHTEETRVVVVDGTKVEEFDFETLLKRQLAGNIYLAKVTRVEPSLQAAFVEYGGNRHGFLAFAEIHPDYYQIPLADREALMREEEELVRAEAEEADAPAEKSVSKSSSRRPRRRSRSSAAKEAASDAVVTEDVLPAEGTDTGLLEDLPENRGEAQPAAASKAAAAEEATGDDAQTPAPEAVPDGSAEETADQSAEAPEVAAAAPAETAPPDDEAPAGDAASDSAEASEEKAESSAADTADASPDAQAAETDTAPSQEGDETDAEEHQSAAEAMADDNDEDDDDDDRDDDLKTEIVRRKPRMRRYKIQEVIKVRQILLVQVVKEERGNKGAALTTYLSLAGRYCVLMPNTARGGGISRKITSAADRSKLKAIAGEISVPKGAGLIIRTAGAKRTKTEVKRDYEFLQRQWEQIRDLTMESIAPALIHEEGSLIKRSIRDLYSRDIDEIFVDGERGYREAKDYMKMLMPSHAKNVKQYSEALPLFSRYQVETTLGAMFNPVVQLKSGGYIVIDVTEALVAVDVNSGRSTRESSIEDTALKTNLEAAEELARQARLRDLAGLIVIDFIDMEDRKNNAAVEKRLKDSLKDDRARIQIGRISSFGLMEMSRQRLRPGMLEATTAPCKQCHGTGRVRSQESLALAIMRELEEEGTRKRSREVLVKVPVEVANYILNAKREHVAMIEGRFGLSVRVEADSSLVSPEYRIERFKTATRVVAEVEAMAPPAPAVEEDDGIEDAEVIEENTEASAESTGDGDSDAPKKKRRRRRRSRSRSKTDDNGQHAEASDAQNAEASDEQEVEADSAAPSEDAPAESVEAAPPKKSRSRRRSRAKSSTSDSEGAPEVQPDSDNPPAEPAEAETKVDDSEAEASPAEPVSATPEETQHAAVEPETAVADAAPAEAPAPVEPPAPVEAATPPAEQEQPAKAPELVTAGSGPKPRKRMPAQQAIADISAPTAPAPEQGPGSEPEAKRRGWWARTLGK